MMQPIGAVESLWRYPVKSMRGEELSEIFAGFSGLYGDRRYAFESSGARRGLPYLTAREQRRMLLYRPRYLHPENTIAPPNLLEAEKLGAGATPVYGDAADFELEVETPGGKRLPIDHPELIELLSDGLEKKPGLSLRCSERAMTDCRPVSLFAVQTACRLSEESGLPIDRRRFRANIYLDLTNSEGFAENAFVGRSLRIGSRLTVAIVARDARCMIINLDPETAEQSAAVLKTVAQEHEGTAGLYAVVVQEGMVHRGDEVGLLD